MARLRQFVHNVGSSYAALGAMVVYTFVSVPLALTFLSREAFGLWALLAQITGYLALIDAGMTGAATRLLIDCKDMPADGAYGRMVKTSFLVALVQASLILLVGFSLARQCPAILDIRPAYADIFIRLLWWQTAITAFAFVTRPLGQMLGAHQRLDIIYYSQILQMTTGLSLIWWFLVRGHGLYSFVFSSAISAGINSVYLFASCYFLRLFPRPGRSGAPSWAVFKEIFAYGKDLFLVAVGTQLIMASQVIIVTRSLGLEVAAVWAVGTRVLNLLLQVVWRISDSASVTLAEMIARGEGDRLRRRYSDIVTVSASLGGLAAVMLASSNALFVDIWTSHKIAWTSLNDVLLGIWMVPLVLIHVHCGFILLTKKIAFMRIVYFIEGCAFVIISLWVLRFGRLPLMITTSILCAFSFSGAYGTWRVAQYFKLPLREVAIDWVKPMVRVSLFAIPVAVLLHFGLAFLPPLPRFLLILLILGAWSGILFGRIGLPRHLQREVLSRSPHFAYPFLQRLFAIG